MHCSLVDLVLLFTSALKFLASRFAKKKLSSPPNLISYVCLVDSVFYVAPKVSYVGYTFVYMGDSWI